MEDAVGSVTVSTFVTLDGVMQDPGGTGEFGRGGWQIQFFDDQAALIARETLFAADALLLGRVTYEHFAAAWPGMTDTGDYGERMNSMPKFVASTTLSDATWNASVVKDAASDVATLKADHELLVIGSGRLIHTLRERGLVDVYEVWVHPTLLGGGNRLFEAGPETQNLELTDTKTTPKGIVVLRYEVGA
jgi:dihydrofolate reductase